MGLSTSNLTTINPLISVQIPSKPNSPDRILGIEKARKIAYFRAFLAFLSCRLSLAELRCATSGFEAVLAYSLAPVFLDFMGFLASALKCCPSI